MWFVPGETLNGHSGREKTSRVFGAPGVRVQRNKKVRL
jgi:hypothetical protein